MPFIAPNYTQTPNVFFDEIMKTLNEGEMRILLIIMRQTFGWHKAEDWITLKLLAEKTGYERRSVCRILDRLIQKRLVYKRIEGPPGMQRCYYGLVTEGQDREIVNPDDAIETEEEKAIFQKSYTSDRRVTPPVTDGSPPPVTGRSPTKESNTKEKEQQQAKPAAAAASFKSSEKEQPKMTAQLKELNIPLADKSEIAGAYDANVIDDAISWATDPKNPPKKCLAASVKFACKNKLTKPVPPVDIEEVNKAYAMKYKDAKAGNARIEVLNKQVEINTGCSYTCVCLPFNAKGFIEQFTNALRKNKFQVLPT